MNKRLLTLLLIILIAFGLAGAILFAADSAQASVTQGEKSALQIPVAAAMPEKSFHLAEFDAGMQSGKSLMPSGGGDWDGYRVDHPRVITDTGGYRMWYSGRNPENPGYGWMGGLADSADGLAWTK